MDLVTVRTALIISLSIVLVVLIFRWFRDMVKAKDLPALAHADLLALQVAYHPARLHIHLRMPQGRNLRTTLLDPGHREVHRWQEETLAAGEHHLQRDLPDLTAGTYYLEVSTATQRIVRQFRLQPA